MQFSPFFLSFLKRCVVNCGMRDLQGHLKVKLEIFKTKHKGWGVRNLEFIKKGTFVSEYVGENLTYTDR